MKADENQTVLTSLRGPTDQQRETGQESQEKEGSEKEGSNSYHKIYKKKKSKSRH